MLEASVLLWFLFVDLNVTIFHLQLMYLNTTKAIFYYLNTREMYPNDQITPSFLQPHHTFTHHTFEDEH
jgi:hypothetical protein